jgi:hypothetical protein
MISCNWFFTGTSSDELKKLEKKSTFLYILPSSINSLCLFLRLIVIGEHEVKLSEHENGNNSWSTAIFILSTHVKLFLEVSFLEADWKIYHEIAIAHSSHHSNGIEEIAPSCRLWFFCNSHSIDAALRWLKALLCFGDEIIMWWHFEGLKIVWNWNLANY